MKMPFHELILSDGNVFKNIKRLSTKLFIELKHLDKHIIYYKRVVFQLINLFLISQFVLISSVIIIILPSYKAYSKIGPGYNLTPVTANHGQLFPEILVKHRTSARHVVPQLGMLSPASSCHPANR